MKYEIRINGLKYREINGIDIEDALDNAGLITDFIKLDTHSAELDFDSRDIIGILNSDETDLINDIDFDKELYMEIHPA